MIRIRPALVALLAALMASLLVAVASPAMASPAVKISKIRYAQTGTNLNTEYIVFKNTTGSARTITGWKIISAPSSDNQYYVFPTTSIPAGASITLYTGSGTNTSTRRYWNATSPRWNNDGDLAILKNGSGTKVDSCQYAGGGTTAYC